MSAATSPKMPFGKFKGMNLTDLPDEYLEWLCSLDDLRQPLAKNVEAEVLRRERLRNGNGPRPCPSPAFAAEIVAYGYRQLSKKYHPDAGGTHEDMVLLGAVADWLKAMIPSARR